MKLNYKHLKLIHRKNLYSFKRYFKWIKNAFQFSNSFDDKKLENKIHTHQTPILRELKNVDLWLQYNKLQNLIIAI